MNRPPAKQWTAGFVWERRMSRVSVDSLNENTITNALDPCWSHAHFSWFHSRRFARIKHSKTGTERNFFFCHASRQQLWKRTTLNCFSLPTLHMSTIVLQIQDSFSPAPHISSGFVEFFANDFNRCADARKRAETKLESVVFPPWFLCCDFRCLDTD